MNVKEDSEFSKKMIQQIDEKVEEESTAYFVNNCLAYNVQWMEKILKRQKVDLNDKTAVSQKCTVYVHMIENEIRRYFDL